MFKPIHLMMNRVEAHGMDSDSTLFSELLYAGELITKITASAVIALIQNDREGQKYRLLHGLIRADGIGDWASAMDQAMGGPPSQNLAASALDMRRVFNDRSTTGSWQEQAVKNLYDVLSGVDPESMRPAERPNLRSWFQLFAQLRNKTRGHGALTPAAAARLVPSFKRSINLMVENNPVINASWAYLHRNLSGRYRVVHLGGNSKDFDGLATARGVSAPNFSPGIYIYSGGFHLVELLQTDLDVADFFLPNGGFRNGTYELHSIITDSRKRGDASSYLAPAEERPPSETQGAGALDTLGNVFSNIPPQASGYVHRPKLEGAIKAALLNDRHPIVTLVGRGGIGKTSVVLSVLHEISKYNRFGIIIWFSARDIDLTISGAKTVKPHVMTEMDMAKEYLRLIGELNHDSSTKPTSIFAQHMTVNPFGSALFVFDNFETVRNPLDLFNWIDTNIRLPNKVVITSRFRDFKADYPIPVSGMENEEAIQLVSQTALSLGIDNLLLPSHVSEIIQEADGHPYVIKILLGEIANAGKYSKPARIIARQDDILDALFERTFASLSPLATRAFLVLCSWRSLVPQLALEATLLRQGDETIDPEAAIDQLVRTSLIERITAGDGSDFLEVPLAAATFGKRKLEVSPVRGPIENDVRFLQDVGATAATGLKTGLAPKIDSLFARIARRSVTEPSALRDARPVMEFLANHHKRAWLLLASIESEFGDQERAAEALRQFLASQPSAPLAQEAWRQLVTIYRAKSDVIAACDAFLRAAAISTPPISEISNIANWLNNSSEAWSHMHVTERETIFGPLAKMMNESISELRATDISRLAWLYLHIGNSEIALTLANEGIKREPGNIYCDRLRQKLGDM